MNRAALVWAALLTGVGAGLFIDEVGKFITVDNDYFFPAAAPIAYAVFLLAVWVYLRARRRRDPGPRAELHAALELIGDALDHDLDAPGHAQLEARLRSAASRARAPELASVTDVLLELCRPGVLPVTADRPGRLRRAARHLDALTDRWLTQARLRRGLIVVLAALGVSALSDLTVITAVAADLADGSTSEVVKVANTFARVDIEDRRGVLLLLTRAVLDICVGLALLAAAVLLARARTARALELAQTGLLLSLTVVNLLVFYLEQFLAALGALVQLGVLYAVQRYQKHRT